MWASPGDTGISQKVWTQASQTGQEAHKAEGTDDQPDWCYPPGGVVQGEFNGGHQATALVHLCSGAFPLHKQVATTAAQ